MSSIPGARLSLYLDRRGGGFGRRCLDRRTEDWLGFQPDITIEHDWIPVRFLRETNRRRVDAKYLKRLASPTRFELVLPP